jgi:hypothetical protein
MIEPYPDVWPGDVEGSGGLNPLVSKPSLARQGKILQIICNILECLATDVRILGMLLHDQAADPMCQGVAGDTPDFL